MLKERKLDPSTDMLEIIKGNRIKNRKNQLIMPKINKLFIITAIVSNKITELVKIENSSKLLKTNQTEIEIKK